MEQIEAKIEDLKTGRPTGRRRGSVNRSEYPTWNPSHHSSSHHRPIRTVDWAQEPGPTNSLFADREDGRRAAILRYFPGDSDLIRYENGENSP